MGVSRVVRTVLLACVITSVTVAAVPAVAVPTFSESVVVGGPPPIGIAPTQANPEMDGRYIVYEYTPGFDTGAVDTDIKVYDVGSGVSYDASDRVGDNDVDDSRPDISMDTVVYQSTLNTSLNVYLYNTTWYNWRAVTNEVAAQSGPRISGRYIIWHDADQNVLYYYCIDWPQYMNQWMPGTSGVYMNSWDIDGDTVIFARKQGSGDFVFYKWTLLSDAAPEAFGTHLGADDIADVRLHNGRMTYTYGAGLDNVGVVMLHSGFGGPLAYGGRDADLFHEMYAYEIISDGDIDFRHNEFWDTTLGTTMYTETNPSVFGNRVAFQRSSYNGDIVLGRSSEPLVDRTAGNDRYETAVAASEEYFRGGADNVVLCTGENFPDALAAAPWARFLKAPVLLTRRTGVPGSVMDEITRLGATDVWIIGSDAAVSPSVKTQLEAAGLTVNRALQGGDRYETAAKISNALYSALMADGRQFSNMAFVARGDSFADALSVAPLAAATYSPIILVKTQAPLPPASEGLFASLPIWHAYIAGGTNVVSVGVEEKIEEWTTHHFGMDSPATRMAGVDRYETSVRVAQLGVALNWVDLDTLGVATGLNFPDALGGGAALGSYGSPLVLTQPGALPPKVTEMIVDYGPEIGRVDIFGSSTVVSDGVRNTIVGLMP